MNKQEFIKNIENAIPDCALNDFQIGEETGLTYALELAKELDEPEKPVVPQFVADFYESIKDDFEDKVYDLYVQYHLEESELNSNVAEWFDNSKNKPIETLVKMKLFGYEVEKEKLYTVEIPNPNGSGYSKTYLAKNKDGKVELFTWSCYTSIEFSDDWKQEKNAQLTEAEIKKDHEWAWRFVEEVNNNDD